MNTWDFAQEPERVGRGAGVGVQGADLRSPKAAPRAEGCRLCEYNMQFLFLTSVIHTTVYKYRPKRGLADYLI